MIEPRRGAAHADVGRLVVQLEGNPWAIVPLNKPVLTIGREPSNDVTLPDPRVSRLHAELREERTGLTITDLGSYNGTWVGDAKILAQRPYTLASGTTFYVVPFVLTFQGPEQFQQRDTAFATPDEPAMVSRPAPAMRAEIPPPAPPSPPRAREPSPIAPSGRSRYLRDLPLIFQENDFLGRYLLIFESLWEPLEQRQDHVAMYFDPRTAPAEFLTWLASWLGLSFHSHWPESRIRTRLQDAMDLYRWRGTSYGLARMIEISTGLLPDVTEDSDDPCVFHVRIQVPADFSVDRDLIQTLIEDHKPAHAGYILEIEQ